MAYMSQESKKEMAPAIKAVLKKYKMKGSIGVRHYSTLVVNISAGPIDFGKIHRSVNEHYIEKHYAHIPVAQAFLTELNDACQVGNYNNSDIMTDYFDVGHYVNINIGKWDKEYILTA
ncbi:hypothetical protein GD1_200 [Paraglaciecola Antarctic GD virus 1]|nr:hypothetical protein GD1_200 [Paraglaciecola Antarctic GD virus 1]